MPSTRRYLATNTACSRPRTTGSGAPYTPSRASTTSSLPTPTWLTTIPYSRDQLIGILHDHIQTVVGHYRGKVAQWDVVNEGLSGGFWWDHIGPEYIAMAFQ